jgi:hypothetical protein
MKLSFFVSYLCASLIMTGTAFAKEISSFQQLKDLIEHQEISSVDELLPHLSRSFRSNFMLVYRSRSRMQASPENPRVILSDANSRFVISFTGSEELVGGQKIEVMEQNPQTKLFEFAQINFDKNKGIHFEKNPTSCLECHQTAISKSKIYDINVHPLWDSYPDWPGIYGTSSRGTIFGSSSLKPESSITQQFEKFRNNSFKRSRYRYLIGLKSISEHDLAKTNSRFGNEIAKLNFEKLGKVVTDNEKFSVYKDALSNLYPMPSDQKQKSFLSDEDFAQLLPKEDQLEYLSKKPFLLESISASNQSYVLGKTKRYQKLLPADSEEVFAALRDDGAGGYQLPSLAYRKIVDTVNYLAKNKSKTQTPRVMANIDYNNLPMNARLDFILEKMGISPESYNLALERSAHATTQAVNQFDVFLGLVRDGKISTCTGKFIFEEY